MNQYSEITHNKEYNIFESGYNEALIDVFDYLTGNLSFIEDSKFSTVQNMMTQALAKAIPLYVSA